MREVAGEGLMRLVRFLDPMYSDKGERLRSKAAAAIAHLATDNEANAEAILRHGAPSITCVVPLRCHDNCRKSIRDTPV